MHRLFDIRILLLGLVVVLMLMARPLDAARASLEATGSIPATHGTSVRGDIARH